MEAQQFHAFRKRLGRTQKELACLLGTSVKAVQAYEQGWRPVPIHVERYLVLLLVLKNRRTAVPRPCWEVVKCDDRVRRTCPVWELGAGDMCWLVGGTRCGGARAATWRQKMVLCRSCRVLRQALGEVPGWNPS